jgi:hypothetical protein
MALSHVHQVEKSRITEHEMGNFLESFSEMKVEEFLIKRF